MGFAETLAAYYKKADTAAHGYLPGGVTPQEYKVQVAQSQKPLSSYGGTPYKESKTMAVEVGTGRIAREAGLNTGTANLEDHHFIKDASGKWVDVGVYNPALKAAITTQAISQAPPRMTVTQTYTPPQRLPTPTPRAMGTNIPSLTITSQIPQVISRYYDEAKEAYNRLDRTMGGQLPGGVPPMLTQAQQEQKETEIVKSKFFPDPFLKIRQSGPLIKESVEHIVVPVFGASQMALAKAEAGLAKSAWNAASKTAGQTAKQIETAKFIGREVISPSVKAFAASRIGQDYLRQTAKQIETAKWIGREVISPSVKALVGSQAISQTSLMKAEAGLAKYGIKEGNLWIDKAVLAQKEHGLAGETLFMLGAGGITQPTLDFFKGLSAKNLNYQLTKGELSTIEGRARVDKREGTNFSAMSDEEIKNLFAGTFKSRETQTGDIFLLRGDNVTKPIETAAAVFGGPWGRGAVAVLEGPKIIQDVRDLGWKEAWNRQGGTIVTLGLSSGAALIPKAFTWGTSTIFGQPQGALTTGQKILSTGAGIFDKTFVPYFAASANVPQVQAIQTKVGAGMRNKITALETEVYNKPNVKAVQEEMNVYFGNLYGDRINSGSITYEDAVKEFIKTNVYKDYAARMGKEYAMSESWGTGAKILGLKLGDWLTPETPTQSLKTAGTYVALFKAFPYAFQALKNYSPILGKTAGYGLSAPITYSGAKTFLDPFAPKEERIKMGAYGAYAGYSLGVQLKGDIKSLLAAKNFNVGLGPSGERQIGIREGQKYGPVDEKGIVHETSPYSTRGGSIITKKTANGEKYLEVWDKKSQTWQLAGGGKEWIPVNSKGQITDKYYTSKGIRTMKDYWNKMLNPAEKLNVNGEPIKYKDWLSSTKIKPEDYSLVWDRLRPALESKYGSYSNWRNVGAPEAKYIRTASVLDTVRKELGEELGLTGKSIFNKLKASEINTYTGTRLNKIMKIDITGVKNLKASSDVSKFRWVSEKDILSSIGNRESTAWNTYSVQSKGIKGLLKETFLKGGGRTDVDSANILAKEVGRKMIQGDLAKAKTKAKTSFAGTGTAQEIYPTWTPDTVVVTKSGAVKFVGKTTILPKKTDVSGFANYRIKDGTIELQYMESYKPQGKGIGTQLIKSLQNKYPGMSVKAVSTGGASGFYSKTGWQSTGTFQSPGPGKKESVDFWIKSPDTYDPKILKAAQKWIASKYGKQFVPTYTPKEAITEYLLATNPKLVARFGTGGLAGAPKIQSQLGFGSLTKPVIAKAGESTQSIWYGTKTSASRTVVRSAGGQYRSWITRGELSKVENPDVIISNLAKKLGISKEEVLVNLGEQPPIKKWYNYLGIGRPKDLITIKPTEFRSMVDYAPGSRYRLDIPGTIQYLRVKTPEQLLHGTPIAFKEKVGETIIVKGSPKIQEGLFFQPPTYPGGNLYAGTSYLGIGKEKGFTLVGGTPQAVTQLRYNPPYGQSSKITSGYELEAIEKGGTSFRVVFKGTSIPFSGTAVSSLQVQLVPTIKGIGALESNIPKTTLRSLVPIFNPVTSTSQTISGITSTSVTPKTLLFFIPSPSEERKQPIPTFFITPIPSETKSKPGEEIPIPPPSDEPTPAPSPEPFIPSPSPSHRTSRPSEYPSIIPSEPSPSQPSPSSPSPSGSPFKSSPSGSYDFSPSYSLIRKPRGPPISPIFSIEDKKVLSRKKKKKISPMGYYVLTMKRKKPVLITPSPLSKGQALSFGVRATSQTPRATFKLIPTAKAPSKIKIKPMTELEVFGRGFRTPIRKGKLQPVSLTFIQKKQTRMSSLLEYKSIQSYKGGRKKIW